MSRLSPAVSPKPYNGRAVSLVRNHPSALPALLHEQPFVRRQQRHHVPHTDPFLRLQHLGQFLRELLVHAIIGLRVRRFLKRGMLSLHS